MKYIRTKYGEIFKVRKESTVDGKKYYDIYHKDNLLPIIEYHVIAQADTIEELIDDYVSVSKCCRLFDGMNENIGDVVTANYVKQKANLEAEDIYGAIWTDKGLIYVAKMNENGKMVLI